MLSYSIPRTLHGLSAIAGLVVNHTRHGCTSQRPPRLLVFMRQWHFIVCCANHQLGACQWHFVDAPGFHHAVQRTCFYRLSQDVPPTLPRRRHVRPLVHLSPSRSYLWHLQPKRGFRLKV